MESLDKSETKWLPDGFHFLGPTEAKNRRQLIKELSEYLEKEGYSEVILPAMDYSVSFMKNMHPEEEKSVLRFRDLNGQELSPGTDLTVQVVKGMAGLSHLTENQNVFYISKRIRDHRKRNASRREILQLGAERLGTSSSAILLKILTEVDELLNIVHPNSRPVIVIGNTILLNYILEIQGWKEGSKEIDELRTLIHTKNSSELIQFISKFNLKKEISSIILQLMNWVELDNAEDFIHRNASQILPSTVFHQLIQSIQIIRDGWGSKIRYSDICMDLSLVRDLKYYSGYLFQGYLPGITEPIITGGQYDHLFKIFSDEPKKACGYAINLDIT